MCLLDNPQKAASNILTFFFFLLYLKQGESYPDRDEIIKDSLCSIRPVIYHKENKKQGQQPRYLLILTANIKKKNLSKEDVKAYSFIYSLLSYLKETCLSNTLYNY